MSKPWIGSPLNAGVIPSLQWVEVATTLQIPSFHIVGLPGPEVAEARERVRSAIQASGFEFPRRRVLLNLSPASIRKQGTGIDLAMALAVLSIAHPRTSSKPKDLPGQEKRWVAWGELGLDGSIKASQQTLRAVYATWNAKVPFLLFPRDEKDEASRSLGLLMESGILEGAPPRLIPVSTLTEAWDWVLDIEHKSSAAELLDEKEEPDLLEQKVGSPKENTKSEAETAGLLPLSPSLERVLGVAASGSHHLLVLGPRGTGKSHAIEWPIALQPPVAPSTRITQILMAELNSQSLPTDQIPIRRISSQARPAALTGNASSTHIRPGEFSMAHGGLLVADEILEWSRDSREILREPMERGQVTLTRTRGTIELPAQFLLAANGNFCPCGGWPSAVPLPKAFPGIPCKCSQTATAQYLARLSGPVLDRIDLVLALWAPMHDKAGPGAHGKDGDDPDRLKNIQEQVLAARTRSLASWGKIPGMMKPQDLELLLRENPKWKKEPSLLEATSLRSRHKIFRAALSLASWDGQAAPSSGHFSEACFYRPERLGLV